MVTAISFRANETTGGVADKSSETAKKETTGGVGVRINNNDSIFTVDNQPPQDTVSFRGNENEKHSSKSTIVLGLTGLTALFIGMALAHKYDAAGKIADKFKNERVKEFIRSTDTVTKPCHDACAWVKRNSYDKIVNYFKK